MEESLGWYLDEMRVGIHPKHSNFNVHDAHGLHRRRVPWLFSLICSNSDATNKFRSVTMTTTESLADYVAQSHPPSGSSLRGQGLLSDTS